MLHMASNFIWDVVSEVSPKRSKLVTKIIWDFYKAILPFSVQIKLEQKHLELLKRGRSS